MPLETKCHLETDTKNAVQELLTMNVDSRDGFRQASEDIEDVTVGSLFQSLAMQRQAQADELARLLECNCEDVDRSGSFAASAHRIWMAFREMLSTNNMYAVLSEAERGEDQIKQAYEKTLKKTAGSAVNDVILQQYGQVKAAHDRIRDLRDEARN